MFKPAFPLAMAVALLAFNLPSRATDLEQEYIQVRKIALKDPRVKDAFEKADERLDEKVLEIDPSLKPIVDRKHGQPVEPQSSPVAHRVSVASEVRGPAHIVVKGDTLSSIAFHYKVTVASLEKANHITNDRKLKVGQKIIIPDPRNTEPQHQSRPESKPQAKAEETPADNNGSLLDWARKNL